MTANELITKEVLRDFKSELINEIKSIIQPEHRQGKQWLKSSEVRKLLTISPGTLQNLRINGTLKYTKIGGIMYYKSEEIYKLLNDGKDVK
ncbi:helix-turn-helix domain-containing protein [Mucilaginibacter antarcticus]|uniref:Helix-turn-helix domain-containing protein n=1 Tax=Mucilaginibacter antarcticus TaxID=1855725 RepID=A0ABW5XIR0_9SPHI